jgi:hypothetical protein
MFPTAVPLEIRIFASAAVAVVAPTVSFTAKPAEILVATAPAGVVAEAVSTVYELGIAAVDESRLCQALLGFPPLGVDLITAVIVIESETSISPATLIVAAVVESDFIKLAVPSVTVTVRPDTAACEGTELRTPRPKEATATSAMRLKFVFVDMYFLSLVVTRNFLVAASR